ncbi:hypothetical protein NQ176_g6318 [Zarea fungicola]|uniref:Uncharacterized protein n=1 Tax=Zarea fungicola TaxID=93591 RepID=A0ACC1N581_9HYPO|nr:hypothetical protein NQ176_g6318 [Lecanicillium fungicola]
MVGAVLCAKNEDTVLSCLTKLKHRLWYHSAQQVRIEHEEDSQDVVIEEESDVESYQDGQSNLDNVPEEETSRSKNDEVAAEKQSPSVTQQTALSELYLHEVMALLSCFSLPLISAYILHMIRSQLSRPSEGLVSNFNLSIFILVSELRVLSHIIKLVQARTLYLQRVVHSNPYGALPTANSLRINAILERLEVLESDTGSRNVLPEEDDETESTKTAAQEATLTKDVRNAIQPELDALNRAVRRYEKKSTLLQSHVDAHFIAMDARVEDAIALAAVAAKNSSQSSILVRGFDAVVTILLFPFNAVLQLLLFPATWLLSPAQNDGHKKKHAAASGARNTTRGAGGSKSATRSARGSKSATSQQRFAGDKMPSRLSRK